MGFQNQIVLIFGAAEGLGSRIASTILRSGAQHVVLVGDATNISASHEGDERKPVCLAEEALDGDMASAAGLKQFDRIDIVINLIGPAECHSDECGNAALIQRTSRIINATRDLLQNSRPHGAVVNVGWLPSETGQAEPSANMKISGSLKLLTQSLAKELAPHIRVNAVLSVAADATAPEEGNIGPILFLASSDARHMTGTILTSDSGRRLGFSAFKKAANS